MVDLMSLTNSRYFLLSMISLIENPLKEVTNELVMSMAFDMDSLEIIRPMTKTNAPSRNIKKV